mgnify:CR=1 FL=1
MIKNISNSDFNLESGVCKPGSKAEATDKEARFLISQGFAETFTPRAKSKSKPVSIKMDS